MQFPVHSGLKIVVIQLQRLQTQVKKDTNTDYKADNLDQVIPQI